MPDTGERWATLTRTIVCPRCGNPPDYLTEHWSGHLIQFDVADNLIDREGNKEMGDPDHVRATCGCGHVWRLRGVKQITELYRAE